MFVHPADDLKGAKSRLLTDKKIVLGVTGSIAAVETIKLARELIRHGADVYPVMTKAAQSIIHPYALQFATGHEPITQLTGKVEHISLCGDISEKVDILLIAPCTSNTISKIACGIDDTPVTTFASTAIPKMPVMIVPAMHTTMYNHPIIKANIEKLKKLGVAFIEPVISEGSAKMPSIEDIVAHVIRGVGKGDLDKKILVVASSTMDPIDDVRAITNRSTGKTGIELAKNAFQRGARVELWYGASPENPPLYIKTHRFETTNDLLSMVAKAGSLDVVLLCAAISDFVPEKRSGKIASSNELVIHFRPAKKIVDQIRSKSKYLVGFKLEAGVSNDTLLERGREFMQQSGVDLVVANDILEVTKEESHVYIIGLNGNVKEARGEKELIAEKILNEVRDLA